MILALLRMSLYVHLNCLKIISENISVTEGRKLVSVWVVVVRVHGQCLQSVDLG